MKTLPDKVQDEDEEKKNIAAARNQQDSLPGPAFLSV
jgi:hypothetical protein